MKNRSWKTVVAFLCIWALAAGFMTAAAVADENEYIFVNGEKRVFTAEGEVSAVLKLPVEEAGRIHILANGVNVALAVYNEDTFEVCGVYYTDNGLMDVPFDAYPGNYLLGFTGWKEVAILVADESTTARLYASAEAEVETASDELPVEQSEVTTDSERPEQEEESAAEPDEEEEPAGKSAEEEKEEVTEKPAEDVTEAAEEDLPSVGQEDHEAADEASPAPAAETPSDLIRYEFKDGSPVSVLSILNDAGAEVNMIRKVTRESDGWFSSLGSSDGDWLLTPFAYFESIEVSVTAGRFDATDASIEDAVYTLVLSYPDPAAEAEPEEMTEEAAEEPAEEPAEEVAEEPAEELTEKPEEDLPSMGQEDREAEEEEFPDAAAEPLSGLIRYEFKDGKPVSVLSVLNDAGAEVNMIRKVTRESEGWFFSTGTSDGDWLLTPYAYFDSMEVSVTAGWFDTADASIINAEYKLMLSYPDSAAEERATESEESLLSGREVTIAMERLKSNEIRLYAENLEPEEDLHYQWQYSMDSENWVDVEDANSSEYTFTLNGINSSKYWRLVVTK